jgi:UrcA family protein
VRKVIGSVAAVVIMLASSLANGSQALGDVRQKVVRYSDLNLSNSADAVTLYNRISHAAHVVCYLPSQLDDETGARTHACVAAAIERSIGEVNAPVLTRYYEARQRKTRTLAMARSAAAVAE